MQILDIDVEDGQSLITVAVKLENFDYRRLTRYLHDCKTAFIERDTALEELAELKKMIKELP